MKLKQQELFDIKEGERLRDQAMDQVEENADKDWKENAYAAIVMAAQQQAEITSDDVWPYIPSDSTTHDNRALGPIMRTTGAEGVVMTAAKTQCGEDKYTLGRNPRHHRAPMRIWRSLVFLG